MLEEKVGIQFKKIKKVCKALQSGTSKSERSLFRRKKT